MTELEHTEFVKKLTDQGYTRWKDGFRHDYYNYYKVFHKDTSNQFSVSFREWDWRQFRHTDPSIKESPYSFDIEITFNRDNCSLVLGYPHVCPSIEVAELVAETLNPTLHKHLTLSLGSED